MLSISSAARPLARLAGADLELQQDPRAEHEKPASEDLHGSDAAIEAAVALLVRRAAALQALALPELAVQQADGAVSREKPLEKEASPAGPEPASPASPLREFTQLLSPAARDRL